MKKASFFTKQYRLPTMLSCVAMFAVCCKSTQTFPVKYSSTEDSCTHAALVPVQSDLGIARMRWPEITMDNLMTGYIIFSDKCMHCHTAKKPEEFTEYAWNTILHKMGRKAKLDSTQYKIVLRYILTKRESILGSTK